MSLPVTRCATRLPASVSGYTGLWTPIRSRILPCLAEIALAQICGMPRSTRLLQVSTLDSIEVPMPTTATGKSPQPSCSSASRFVVSASTTRVRREDHSWTSAGSRSMASTSWPSRARASAVPDPKRPRPQTRTAPSSPLRPLRLPPALVAGRAPRSLKLVLDTGPLCHVPVAGRAPRAVRAARRYRGPMESLRLAWDERFRAYDFGSLHPMAPIRLELTARLVADFGLMAGP